MKMCARPPQPFSDVIDHLRLRSSLRCASPRRARQCRGPAHEGPFAPASARPSHREPIFPELVLVIARTGSIGFARRTRVNEDPFPARTLAGRMPHRLEDLLRLQHAPWPVSPPPGRRLRARKHTPPCAVWVAFLWGSALSHIWSVGRRVDHQRAWSAARTRCKEVFGLAMTDFRMKFAVCGATRSTPCRATTRVWPILSATLGSQRPSQTVCPDKALQVTG